MFVVPPDPDEGFCQPVDTDPQPALRLWVCDAQWQAILSQLENQSVLDAKQLADEQNLDTFWQRGEPRWPHQARCLIRVNANQGGGGTYLARTRNISTGGVGFVHASPLQAQTRCTLALQTAEGVGRITAGTVAWCREVSQSVTTQPAFEIGVQFDQPIDLDPVLGDAA